MKSRTKARAPLAGIAVAAIVLTGCSGSTESSGNSPGDGNGDSGAASVSLRWGHLYETTHPFHVCGVQPLADELNAGDSGIQIQIFPAGQLGNEQEALQSTNAGDLDISSGGPGAVANWYTPISVLDAAYAVDDWEHMRAVWDSDVGEEFRAGLEDGGLVPVDLWFHGTRHLTTSGQPVRAPSDLAGMKVRALDTPVSLANAAALGADPVPVSFDELYIALSQGVVDGQENPLPTIESLSVYEVQDYLNLTGHLLQATIKVMSVSAWERLSDDQQVVLTEAMEAAGERVRECIQAQENDLLSEWEADGVWSEIIHPEDIDLEAFRASAEEALPSRFADTWGDLYERVRALAGS